MNWNWCEKKPPSPEARYHSDICLEGLGLSPIAAAARSKASTLFVRSTTGIVGSNPTQDMDVCVRLFCLCVVLCAGSGLATGRSPVQEVLPTALRMRNWSVTKRFTDALCSKVGATGKRERLSKSTKFLTQDNQCLCRDWNRASPRHKSEVLLFEPVCSVQYYE
jgi:hypothetical protein